MSTFMMKNSTVDFTPVSNIFIETYMPKARGEFVKVYLLMLKYSVTGELGVNSSIIASNLSLLESDVMNALNYWHDENLIKLVPIDKMGNFNIEFVDLKSLDCDNNSSVNLLEELNKNDRKDMLKDIEMLTGRPLSPKEMTTYLSWQNDFKFTSEIILLLIEYCVSKGKSDIRYIEKVALGWHDAGIKTLDDAQSYITRNEDKWIKIKKILNYLGVKNGEVMKPQEDLINKWLYNFKFPIDVILKACEICFQRLNRADFKYIDGILIRWHSDNLKTLTDINEKDSVIKQNITKRKTFSKEKTSNTLRFNNFDQRVYDYDSLEKKLLGWDDND